MGLKYYGTDAEIKTFTNKTFSDQIKLLQDRENDITATAREVIFSVSTVTLAGGASGTSASGTLHELQLSQDTSTYEADGVEFKKHGIIIDCGSALSGDAELPL